MELTVAKKDLLKIVARMQGVAERKSTMPVLANVLLAADGNNALRLAATDLYLWKLWRRDLGLSRPAAERAMRDLLTSVDPRKGDDG